MKTTATPTAASTVTVHPAAARGHADHGWLNTAHSFSFADYYDPAHMGFRSLRVINDDHIAAGRGFPTHPHRDMEIFSYILAGALAHRDSLGNVRVLSPGQVQLMSAGSGVTHSEFNPSATEPAHLLQIWILPRERGLTPSYTEWQPRADAADRAKTLLISPDGRDGSATIHQDAVIHRLRLKAGETVTHDLASGRGAWLQVIAGELTFNDTPLAAGDGASTETAGRLTFTAATPVEALLFDLQ
ncbi:pirin family protein [Horticoccus luteus]|uniref:Pirin family protein n=1 Tax=Horticoccus luteus TaxID=2862869 RepID=A0A8F9TW72_9BACT|nr:pirin family protein [Horticoccus luteus]QYM79131.1 pirin family protein [Horticoccus luteus]